MLFAKAHWKRIRVECRKISCFLELRDAIFIQTCSVFLEKTSFKSLQTCTHCSITILAYRAVQSTSRRMHVKLCEAYRCHWFTNVGSITAGMEVGWCCFHVGTPPMSHKCQERMVWKIYFCRCGYSAPFILFFLFLAS